MDRAVGAPSDRGAPATVAHLSRVSSTPQCRPAGDSALALSPPAGVDPEALRRAVVAAELPGVLDALAGTVEVLVHYDPILAWAGAPDAPSAFDALAPSVCAAAARAVMTDAPAPRLVELPACYDADLAPDLADVAAHAALPVDEVIARHLAATYTVGLVGFLPGFAYLHGLDPRLALPRRDTPRTLVPAGSVGIADRMTGVYPAASPGGWHLIAMVPVPMFDPEAAPPARLARGDRVRFVRIDRARFEALARGAR